ncbi:MAG: DUF1549 and DUF1553 domain-containing protein [Gemmataceae bacterium]|nr:DUF1549 and DUF1553 domain-containing protein [Gemmataceae bacterium]
MNRTWIMRAALFVTLLCVSSSAWAQRPKSDVGAPTASGKVVAFEADKSIAVEVKQRGGQSKKFDFAIVKDKTKVEFLGVTKTIDVGTEVKVWADKDNPKTAARIVAGTPQPGNRKPQPKKADEPTAKVTPPPPKPQFTIRNPQLFKRQSPAVVANAIDREIQRVLDAEGIRASGPADDAEFLRRAYVDIIGKIPTPEKVIDFLESKDDEKRTKLIEELLATRDYGLHFADLWCDRINVKDMPIYREPFIAWMSESLNQGRGWDEVVLDLLTAEGQFNFSTRGKRLASTDPQALFLLLNTEEGAGKGPNPAWLAAESGRLFLGVQLQCAECHNHPFTESWKQTDFWGMAAFFSRLRTEKASQGGLQWKETPATTDKPLSVVIPPTALKNIGKTVPARLLGKTTDYQPGEQQLLRHELARWMTAAENPYFAKAAVNRMWAHFFGRGLVNPVDDLHDDNPASHPAILDLLAAEFKNSGFDQKHLIRCICQSQAYQRTSVPQKDNDDNHDKYCHMAVKVMGPGVFYDCLKIATGFGELKVGLPERKTKLTVITQFTPREVFVDFFRAAQGEEANPLENTHGIPQALKLMNAAQLSTVSPVVQRLTASGMDRAQTIEQLYLTAFARRPSAAESKLIADFLARRNDATLAQGYAAVLWTLINSAEFVSNH